MADYLRLSDDEKLSHEDKFALAVSGWLAGANKATTNLPVALSMLEVRNLVRKYLTERSVMKRKDVLQDIKSQEGGTPRLVAEIIAHMKPPAPLPEADPERPLFYELSVPGYDKEPPVNYYVQLPPEYDPYRRYPTVVTLNGAGTTPEQQVDWWAGGYDQNRNRQGQAMRQGYIVVAIDWRRESQTKYEFSAREHFSVLSALRDACRRFSIDTDRVYLSGHSMGGDAAWDLGLSHPDLWAGVIPIVARTDKYCGLYWQNASLVPFYFLGGELDGDKTVTNAHDLDRYFKSQHPHYDVTLVEYLGRGHEGFHEDIQHIFDWMGRRTRNFFPRSFKTVTMRSWDNYFWWLELHDLPERSLVDPADWPPPKGFKAAPTGRVTQRQHHHGQDRGSPHDDLALARIDRFRPADPHHGQRSADQNPQRGNPGPGLGDAARGRPHAGRAAAPVLGQG